MILRENFDVKGAVGQKHRQFEKPTFHKEREGKLPYKTTSTYKRHKLKKDTKRD
jgi:hypothetical protein